MSEDLSDQVRSAGFGDTLPEQCSSPFGCSPPTHHPIDEDSGITYDIVARFAISDRFSVGGGLSSKNLGGSRGYRGTTPEGEYINSYWEAIIYWVGAYWTPVPQVRFGGGPGLYQLSAATASLDMGPPPDQPEYWPLSESVTSLGAMFEIGFEAPTTRLFFFDLSARYHFIPRYNVEHGDDNFETTLRPNWSHIVIAVGVGVRI